MNPYKSDVEQVQGLQELIVNRFDEFEKLNKYQIEMIIFYLKSIHGKAETTEPSWQELDKFEKSTLLPLRNSDEQIALMRSSRRQAFLTEFAFIFCGGLISASIAALLLGHLVFCSIFSLACLFLYYAAEKKMLKLLLINKDQDRRYFLASLRAARNCTELDWAGLFVNEESMRPGPRSNEDLQRVKDEIFRITQGLRDALYNDEYGGRPLNPQQTDRKQPQMPWAYSGGKDSD